MEVRVKNNLEQRIEEYQKKTGATKTWIFEQVGISKQRAYPLMKSTTVPIDVVIRFAIILQCEIEDLFELEVIEQKPNVNNKTI